MDAVRSNDGSPRWIVDGRQLIVVEALTLALTRFAVEMDLVVAPGRLPDDDPHFVLQAFASRSESNADHPDPLAGLEDVRRIPSRSHAIPLEAECFPSTPLP